MLGIWVANRCKEHTVYLKGCLPQKVWELKSYMTPISCRGGWEQGLLTYTEHQQQTNDSTQVQLAEPMTLLGFLEEHGQKNLYRRLGDPQTAASLPSLTSSWLTTTWKLHHGVLLLISFLPPAYPCFSVTCRWGVETGERVVAAIPNEGLLPTSILGMVNSSVSITINLTPVLLYPTCCLSYCIKAISTSRWWSCHAQEKQPYDSNHTTDILEGEIEKRKEAEKPRTEENEKGLSWQGEPEMKSPVEWQRLLSHW